MVITIVKLVPFERPVCVLLSRCHAGRFTFVSASSIRRSTWLLSSSLLLWILAVPAQANERLTVEQLLQEHQKTIASLGNFRVVAAGEMYDEATRKYTLFMEEVWVHAGAADRFTSRTYQYYNSQDKLVVQDTPLHYDISHDDREVRNLSNWDPDESVELPGPVILFVSGEQGTLFAISLGHAALE